VITSKKNSLGDNDVGVAEKLATIGAKDRVESQRSRSILQPPAGDLQRVFPGIGGFSPSNL
jgi:hypothetical protein